MVSMINDDDDVPGAAVKDQETLVVFDAAVMVDRLLQLIFVNSISINDLKSFETKKCRELID